MGDDEGEDDARCSPAGFSRHAVKGSSQPGTNRQAQPGDSTEKTVLGKRVDESEDEACIKSHSVVAPERWRKYLPCVNVEGATRAWG
jgi:hypothetical protein